VDVRRVRQARADHAKGIVVPTNRRAVPRAERTAEILDAAATEFLAKGYEGATISSVASAAGMTPANVYWYFPSKDHLFAAVMDRMLDRELERLDTSPPGPNARAHLVQGMADMRGYRYLHSAMHERLDKSPEVRQAHDRFMTWLTDLVRETVQDGNHSAQEQDYIVEIAVFLFEGFSVPLPLPRPGHELMDFLLSRMTDSA
jgi:AcrR family transcriptional regulator